MLEVLLFLLILFVPGFIVTKRLGLEFWERTVYSIVISVGISAFIFYTISFFTKVTPELAWAYFGILFVLLIKLRKDFYGYLKLVNKKSMQNKSPYFWLVLVPFLLVIFAGAYAISYLPAIYHDDYVFHVPAINEFAENGQKTLYNNPKNLYEFTSNQAPLLFHSFAGTLKMFFVIPFWELLSPLSLILAGISLYFITKSVKQKTLLPTLFWMLSGLVFAASLSANVDIFLCFAFFSSILFLFKHIEESQRGYLYLAGFFAGLTILTKITGIILVSGLIIFLLFEKKYRKSVLFLLTTALTTVVFFAQKFYMGFSLSYLKTYAELPAQGFLQNAAINFSTVFNYLVILFSTSNYFFLIVLGFVPLALLLKKRGPTRISTLGTISFWVFVIATSIVAAQPRLAGFPRYFAPVLGLIALSAGINLELVLEKIRSVRKHFLTASIIFVLLLTLFDLTTYTKDAFFMPAEIDKEGFYGTLTSTVPNDPSSVVYVANSGPIILGLEKVTYYDLTSSMEYYTPACDFLKDNEIKWVIYSRPDKIPVHLPPEFGQDFQKSLDTNKCSKFLGGSRTWVGLFEITE